MNIYDLIRAHEGERRLVYDDADGKTLAPGATVVGNPTVGVGRNLIGKGLSADEINYLLHNDVAAVQSFLDRYPWFHTLSDVLQAALMDLAFNEGEKGFATFSRMIAALAAGDYTTGASDLLNSKGARQLPGRYQELARMLDSGQWPQAGNT